MKKRKMSRGVACFLTLALSLGSLPLNLANGEELIRTEGTDQVPGSEKVELFSSEGATLKSNALAQQEAGFGMSDQQELSSGSFSPNLEDISGLTDAPADGIDSILQNWNTTVDGTDPSEQVSGMIIDGTNPTVQVSDTIIDETGPAVQITDMIIDGTVPSAQVWDPIVDGTDPAVQVSDIMIDGGINPSVQAPVTVIDGGINPSVQAPDTIDDGTDPVVRVSDSIADGTDPSVVPEGQVSDAVRVTIIEPQTDAGQPTESTGSLTGAEGQPTGLTGSLGDAEGQPTGFTGSLTDTEGQPTGFAGSLTDTEGQPTGFAGSLEDAEGQPTDLTVSLADAESMPASSAESVANAAASAQIISFAAEAPDETPIIFSEMAEASLQPSLELSAVSLAGVADESSAPDMESFSAEYDYQLSDQGIVITRYKGTKTAVFVPEWVSVVNDAGEAELYPVVSIGEGAFRNLTDLTSISLPQTVTTIGNSAFYGCTGLEGRLVLPEGLTIIGDSAFYNCSALRGELVLPAELTDIGGSAFYQCTGFTGTLEIPAGVRKINSYTFYQCRGLTGLILPDGLNTIEYQAFDGCSGLTGELVIPDTVTSVSSYAFRDCSSLSGITLSQNMTKINSWTFSGCLGLTGTLTIPDQIKSIGTGAFYNASGLTEIVFGKALTNLVSYYYSDQVCFGNCSGVKTVTFTGEKPPYIANSETAQYYDYTYYFFQSYGLTSLETIWVPEGCYRTYVDTLGSYLLSKTRIREVGAEDFLIENGVLMAYLGEGTQVRIPDEVTEIGSGAFRNNQTVQKVILPPDLESIGDYAFSQATSLQEIEFSDTVETIGDYAFSGCVSFTGVLTLPDSLASIGSYAFNGCSGLTEIPAFPENLTEIKSNAFKGCSGLSVMAAFPADLKALGAYAFSGCNHLTGLPVFPESMTKLEDGIFYGCSSLTGTLVIPSTIQKIGSSAFCQCSGLTGVSLQAGLEQIGSQAFDGCSGLIGELVIPDTVTIVDSYAFRYCSGLTGVTLSQSMTKVYSRSFYGCSGLTGTLVIPDQIKSIGQGAFYNASKLTEIVFGTGLTNLVSYYNSDNICFGNCSGVKSVTFTAEKPPYVANSETGQYYEYTSYFFQSYGWTALETIYVPKGCYRVYSEALAAYLQAKTRILEEGTADDFLIENGVLTAYLGNETVIEIPAGVTAIGRDAFRNNPTVEKVILPAGVETIGDYAFSQATALKTVIFSDTIVSIGSYAFYGCKNLTGSLAGSADQGESETQPDTLTLPGELTAIGSYAFSDCSGLGGTLALPEKLAEIGSGAFRNCTGLTGLGAFSSGLQTLGSYAFYNCQKLSGQLILPENLEKIEDYTFYSCSRLSGTLVIPSRVQRIGSCAFYQCREFTGLSLQTGLNQIGYQAFDGCNGLTGELVIPDTVTLVDSYAFRNCSGLTGVTLSQAMTKIYGRSFYGCSGLTGRLVIPDQIKSIGSGAFYNASGLTEIVFGTGLTNLVSYYRSEDVCFGNCNGVKTVTFTAEKPPYVANSETGQYYEYTSYFFQSYGLTSLETIWVPKGLYHVYTDTLISYLQSKTRIRETGVDAVFQIENGVLTAYLGDETDVVIPGEVKAIGRNAFRNNHTVERVTMPVGLETIGEYAFSQATALKEVVFSNTITSIGAYAFNGCVGLTGSSLQSAGQGASESQSAGQGDYKSSPGSQDGSATQSEEPAGSLLLPEALTQIGSYAFSGCNGLTGTLTFPEKLVGIDSGAFQNCTGLTGLGTFPAVFQTLGSYAFYGCKNLCGQPVLPENLDQINDYTFYGCSSLSGTLVIPPTVTKIGSNAFYQCRGFTGLSLQTGLNQIGYQAFDGCNGLTGELVIPDTVTLVDSYAFRNCSGLTGVTLSQAMTKICTRSFYGCSGLTGTLEIPDQIKSIGNGAFYNASKLTEIVFGTGLTNLVSYYYSEDVCFGNCNGVKTVTFTTEKPPYVGNSETGQYYEYTSYFFQSYGLTSLETIWVPAGCFRTYTNTLSSWLQTKTRIRETGVGDFLIENGVLTAYFGDEVMVDVPEGVTEIGKNAFRNNQTVERVTLPEGLVVIGDHAFSEATALREVVFPASLQIIRDSAFYQCKSLSGTLNLPEHLVNLGSSAFSGCIGLTGLGAFPEKLEILKPCVFYNCRNLSGELVLSETLTDIGEQAFYGCAGLSGNLVIPSSVKKLGYYAFYGCKGFSVLCLTEGLQSIGYNCFENCSGLTGELVLPDTVTSVGSSAFRNCSGLTGLKLSEAMTRINGGTFYGCSGLNGSLIIPDQILSIGDGAFYSAVRLTDITFGRGLSNLYSRYNLEYVCFGNCRGVKTVTFLGEKPPYITDSISGQSYNYANYLFNSYGFSSLEAIYTLPAVLEKYETALKTYVPARVVFSSDTMTLPVSRLTAVKVTSQGACLSWEASLNERVVGYRIYRDEELTAQTDHTDFTDHGLSPETSYTYTVCGYTEEGEETAPAALRIRTSLPQVVSITTNNKYNKVGNANGVLNATVRDTGNLEGAVGQFFYTDREGVLRPIGGTLDQATGSNSNGKVYTTAWDISGIPSDTYPVTFALTDSDGGQGSGSAEITVDDARPEALSGISAVGDTNQIVLSWSTAHELDAVRYQIYRRREDEDEFALIKKIYSRDILTYTDTRASSPIKYYYYVTAVNDFGQEGDPSRTVAAVPRTDTEKPRVVQLTPVNGSILGGTVDFYAQAEDNVAVVRTELYLSVDGQETWEQMRAVRDNYCSFRLDTTALQTEQIFVKGLAWDAAENVSSDLIYMYRVDNLGPEKVQGLRYESTSNTLTLRWEDVADEDLAFFRVEKKEADGSWQTLQDVYTTLGVNFYHLPADTAYTYRVTAYDQLGNRGEPSEELVAATQADSLPPVITALSPGAGYYAGDIPVRVTATDQTGVSSMVIQVSRDALIWTDVRTIDFSGTNQSETGEALLAAGEYGEGSLYFRGVARDVFDNESDTGRTAPFVQVILDLTAPDAPADVEASTEQGAIEIRWSRGEEEDLAGYEVYRSNDGESYELVAEDLFTLNYWDRSAGTEETCFYRVAVKDKAGNRSELSEAVQAQLPEDQEAPEILSYVPETGSVIGPSNAQFQLLASDNRGLRSVRVIYTVNEDPEEKLLFENTELDDYYDVASAYIPLDTLKDGDRLVLKAVVEDEQGLTDEAEGIVYTVDKTGPRVKELAVTGEPDRINVSWKGNREEDLAGYRIYRKSPDSSYALIATRAAADSDVYTYADVRAEKKETYYYKVEAVDVVGNSHARESEAVWRLVAPEVKAALSLTGMQEVDVEYVYDAAGSFADLGIRNYSFDFGDGTGLNGTSARVIHRYEQTGTYMVTLTVEDTAGTTASVSETVQVEEARLLGSLKVRTVDAQGRPLSEMPVYFDLDNTADNRKTTDADGYVTFTAEAGAYCVGAYRDGFLPVQKSVVIRAGIESGLTLTMVEEPIVTGEFEIHRMTLDEIVAAGISVTDPANQQTVRVVLNLVYGSTPVRFDMITNGKKVFSGGTKLVDSEDGLRTLTAYPVRIPGTGTPVEPGSGGGSGSGQAQEGVIVAILDVPAEASCLKEFFDVKLHIVNHADTEFVLTNNQVTLHVPEGMSLVATNYATDEETRYLPSIYGQSEQVARWVLRGDDAGEYDLTADYSGILDRFHEPVTAVFQTANPIKVFGLDAMKLIAEINSRIVNGALYFNLSLLNQGDVTMYRPDIRAEDVIVAFEKDANKTILGNEISDDMELPRKTLEELGRELTTASGVRQTLAEDVSVEALAAGEMFTRRYACYDTITSDDIAYLQQAVKKVASDYGVDVEIRMVDFDLYSTVHAEEKVFSMLEGDTNKESILAYFMDVDVVNFAYHARALMDDSDLGKQLGNAYHQFCSSIKGGFVDYMVNFVRAGWAGWTGDLETFKDAAVEMYGDTQRELTREYICRLLEDESFVSLVETNVNTKYWDTTKKLIDGITGKAQYLPTEDVFKDLEGDEAAQKAWEQVKECLNTDEAVSTLAGAWKSGGTQAMLNKLGEYAKETGNKLLVTGFKDLIARDEVLLESSNLLLESMGLMGKFEGKVDSVVNGFTALWKKSAVLENQYLTVNAAGEEALAVLKMILDSSCITDYMRAEVEELYQGVQEGFASLDSILIDNIANAAWDKIQAGIFDLTLKGLAGIGVDLQGADKVVREIIQKTADVLGVFGIEFAPLENTDLKAQAFDSLRVAAMLTAVFQERMNLSLSGEAYEDYLKALKYLIKMRILGERSFIDMSIELGEGQEILDWLNRRYARDFGTLDEFYQYFRTEMIRKRDILFGEVVTLEGIPAAPELGIDFTAETLDRTLDENYEYSWDGISWIRCDGTAVPLEPANVGKALYVRMAATAQCVAGNMTLLQIPERPMLSMTIHASYKNGRYRITAPLPDASFIYRTGDTKQSVGTVGQGIMNQGAVFSAEGEAILEGLEYKPWIFLTLPAGANSFASQERAVEVVKALTLHVTARDATAGAAVSASAGGSVSGGGEYLPGEKAVLQAAADHGYHFLGWFQNGVLLGRDPTLEYQLSQENVTLEARFEKNPVTPSPAPPAENPVTPPTTPPAENPSQPSVTGEPAHTHTWSDWTRSKEPDVMKEGQEIRSCSCGETQTRPVKKLTPTLTLNVSGTLPMKTGQTSKDVKVSGLARGDAIASVRSSHTGIVTVKVSASGQLTLKARKKTGKAKIIIRLASGLERSLNIKVQKSKVKTKTVTVAATRITLKKGETFSLDAGRKPVTSREKITYSSSDKKVVSVSRKGIIKGRKKGKAKITVKSGNKKRVVTVTVQ